MTIDAVSLPSLLILKAPAVGNEFMPKEAKNTWVEPCVRSIFNADMQRIYHDFRKLCSCKKERHRL